MPIAQHETLIEEGKTLLNNAPQLYIDVDVEADGKPGHGSLLSIGAIASHGGAFYIELAPANKEYIASQRQFCEDHGLERERLIREGTEPTEAIRLFGAWTLNLAHQYEKPPVFSAFNAGFDYGFIDLYMIKAGLDNPYGIAPFDLKSAAQSLSGNWDWAQTNKGRLPKALLPDGDFTHNALEDAVYQQKIHFALAGLLRSKS